MCVRGVHQAVENQFSQGSISKSLSGCGALTAS